ncbi:hypothetical protein C0431_12125 [bacterium]|nr:hypothetical protein [bacterium]
MQWKRCNANFSNKRSIRDSRIYEKSKGMTQKQKSHKNEQQRNSETRYENSKIKTHRTQRIIRADPLSSILIQFT